MAVDFSQFTPKTSAQSTDYIVGYDVNASGGEKKYTVSTLANAVSSVASLGTVKSVTGTAPISVANGTTTPAISIAAATTSAAGVAELATLAEVQTGIGSNTIVTPENLITLLNTLSTNIMNTVGNYPYVLLTDTKSAGTNGTTYTTGGFRTVTLNTKNQDLNNICTLNTSTNQFQLNSGNYRFDLFVRGVANASMDCAFRIYNTSIASSLVQLPPLLIGNVSSTQTKNTYIGSGQFNVSNSSHLHELQIATDVSSYLLPFNASIPEVYWSLNLYKVG